MEETKKVETEIAEKVIEKSSEDPQPQPVVEKKKKPRTQKQKEAQCRHDLHQQKSHC